SETFTESSLDIITITGITGSMEVSISNQTNVSLENVSMLVEGKLGYTNENGSYSISNITPGIRTVKISLQGYKTLSQEVLVLPFITSHHKIIMELGDGEKNVFFDDLGCSIIFAIFSIFPLLGSLSALRRKHIDVAIAGSIIGIFSFGFLMIGSLLSIAAFIIIVMSKEEFDNGKKGKIF
ncbi:MAG: hypothetical protein JSW62_02165, partial [Thermoplasmatales archaeon]